MIMMSHVEPVILMVGIRDLCERIVPAKHQPRAAQTYRLKDSEFTALWRLRKEAFLRWKSTVRQTQTARIRSAELHQEYLAADKKMIQAMADARARHWVQMADEVQQAFVKRDTTGFFRAVRNINARPSSDLYEQDGMVRGAVRKMDGTLTKTPKETMDRWTEYFTTLFTQECTLTPYPEEQEAAIYCGMCRVVSSAPCADTGPAEGTLQWERDALEGGWEENYWKS